MMHTNCSTPLSLPGVNTVVPDYQLVSEIKSFVPPNKNGDDGDTRKAVSQSFVLLARRAIQ